MPLAWYLPRAAQMAVLALGCVAAIALVRARQRSRFPWARPVRTGSNWACIVLMVMIFLKSVNVFAAVTLRSALVSEQVALYEFVTFLLLAGAAYLFGFSLSGLRQALRAEPQDRSAAPPPRRRDGGFLCFGSVLVLLVLGLGYEVRARGLEARLKSPEFSEAQVRAASGSVWRFIDPRVGAWIAASRQAPPDVLRDLAQSALERTRAGVAWNPRTPIDVVRVMARDRSALVRSEAASNQSAPGDLLLVLGHDGDESVRVAVARNPQIPASLLVDLASDSSPNVRYQVAAHDRAPADVLETLSTDAEVANPVFPYVPYRTTAPCHTQMVKTAVAGNAATPSALIDRLGHDPDCSVRLEVTGNKRVPAATLLALEEDGEPSVKSRAKMTAQLRRLGS